MRVSLADRLELLPLWRRDIEAKDLRKRVAARSIGCMDRRMCQMPAFDIGECESGEICARLV